MSRVHGIIDYFVVLFLAFAPSIFNLPELATTFAYILAVVHLVLTILTYFKFGVVKLISFPLHGVIELLVSFALVLVLFSTGENFNAPNIPLGNVLFIVNAFSYGLYLILVKPLTKKYHAITLMKWLFFNCSFHQFTRDLFRIYGCRMGRTAI